MSIRKERQTQKQGRVRQPRLPLARRAGCRRVYGIGYRKLSAGQRRGRVAERTDTYLAFCGLRFCSILPIEY